MKVLNCLLHLIIILLNVTVLYHINTKLCVKLDGRCSKQDIVISKHKRVVNICIVYKINLSYIHGAFTLGSSLFGAIKLTKNANTDV